MTFSTAMDRNADARDPLAEYRNPDQETMRWYSSEDALRQQVERLKAPVSDVERKHYAIRGGRTFPEYREVALMNMLDARARAALKEKVTNGK